MPLRFLTAGESHGPSLTAILDGMPAGLPITPPSSTLNWRAVNEAMAQADA
jgi:chorismate synthase